MNVSYRERGGRKAGLFLSTSWQGAESLQGEMNEEQSDCVGDTFSGRVFSPRLCSPPLGFNDGDVHINVPIRITHYL